MRFWKIPSLCREIANFHEYEVRGGDSIHSKKLTCPNTVKGQIFAVVLISLCSRSMIFPRN